MILKYLKDNGTITLKDASKHAQLSLEDTQGVLNELINYGYVERNGFKKYILTEKVYYSLGDDVGYIKDKELEYIRAKDMIIQYLKKIILSTILKLENYADAVKEKQNII